nr:protein ABHD11 [Ipomoea batatas]
MSGALRNRQARSIVNRLLIFSTPVHSRLISTLAFDEVRSSPDRPYTFTALILHGLLGSGRNWRSFSRSLASSLPSEWRMILVDLRNHGRSAEIGGFEPPHTMENAANDVANLVKSQGWNWPDVVIGHSMGGKVTLQFAQSCSCGDYGQSAQLPKQLYFPAVFDGFMGQCGNSCFIDINSTSLDAEQLWILDSVPGKVGQENSDGEVEKVLQTLQSLPSSIPSRNVETLMPIPVILVLSVKTPGHYLCSWANSLCQGANLPLPVPLKVDKIRGGARLGFITVEDNGETQVLVYIDCVVSPATNTSPTPMFRATRNGAKKDEAAPGEPRIMRSLLAALQKSVEIARV